VPDESDVIALSQRPEPGDAVGVVAKWQGGEIRRAELDERMGGQLTAMQVRHMLKEHELQIQTLEALLVERLLEEEVTRKGLKGIGELLRVEVDDAVGEPSDAEVQELYPVVRSQLQGASLEEARPLLLKELRRRKKENRYLAYIDSLQASRNVSLFVPYPDLPRVDIDVFNHDPVRGDADAPVTIVQFVEYQCFYCQQVEPTVDRILEEYEGRVRLFHKDYTASNHPRALPAAVTAHCAGEQGRYWPMNKLLMANQKALGDGDLIQYAVQLELDVDVFRRCLSSGRHEAEVSEDLALGKRLGVNATPTFFINGIQLQGAAPYEQFTNLIDRELAEKKRQ